MAFKYLLILLKTLDCLLFVLKLFFPIDAEKSPCTFFGTGKIPLCNPSNPFSKFRALNGSVPSVLLHFGSSDLTSGSYRTKCELVIRIGQRSQVPCFNKTSLYCVMLQRSYLNTGIQHACMFLMTHLEHVERSSFIVMAFDLLFSLLIRACLNDDTGIIFVGIVIFLWINRQYDFFHGENSQLKDSKINP